ncbi:MAG: glycosyltransferase [Candidatus Sumerlaeia bacterium]|nr:glycosyltransferase [Candidatus Sumerlaeia bacterium]
MSDKIKIIFLQPVDAVAKNFHRFLSSEKEFEITQADSLRSFATGVKQAQLAIINTTKFDHPRFSLRLLGSMLVAKFYGVPTINIFTTDIVDLCDNFFITPLLYFINFLMMRLSTKVLLLESRMHIARRYFLSSRKLMGIQNYVDNELWYIPRRKTDLGNAQTLTLLYHGELLWWHGLERIAPIVTELQKKCPVQVIVAGNLYPTCLNFLGIEISRREREIKQALREFLQQPYVKWLGRIEQGRVKELMRSAHFQIVQLTSGYVVADTEVRTCLLEALAGGMPCLHIPTPALTRLPFKDGTNIIFINPEQPVYSAEKIWSIFNNIELNQSISEQGQLLARQRFDFKSWFEQTGKPLVKTLARTKTTEKSRLIQILDLLTRPIGVPVYYLITLVGALIVKQMVKTRFSAKEAQALANLLNNTTIERPSPATQEKEALKDEDLPIISVIIPVYRSEHTLARCLDSIMQLDYPETKREIIIVDNNSPDNSRRIAEKYRVRIITEPNQGRAFARNAGVNASRGEFIAFTDSDCIVQPGWLKQFVMNATQNPDVRIFGGRVESIALSPDLQKFFITEGILSQADAISGKMLSFPFVITANAFIRREVFDRIGLFDTELQTAEDTDWGWRAHFAGIKMAYLPDNVVWHFHPVSPAGIFHQFYEYGVNETRVFLKHHSRLREKELSQRLWLMPWTYRRTMKIIFLCLPFWFLLSGEKINAVKLILAKELGYRAGRLTANFAHPETWRWFNIFVTD